MKNDVLNKLKTPAILLIIIGALNGLLGILTLLSGMIRLAGIGGKEPFTPTEAEKFGYYFSTFVSYASALMALIAAPVIIYGAIQMLKGRNYRFAKAAAVLAIIPLTSCCFLIGIPIGIWAIAVLNKPDVKAFFEGEDLPAHFMPPEPPRF